MGNKSCCIRRRSKQGSKFTPISSYGSQKTGREVSVNFLPHISEREFIEDAEQDPSTHPTVRPTFMERSKSEMKLKDNRRSFYVLDCTSLQTHGTLKKSNSCSTIFLDDSTISQPNLKNTIKCISLAIYYHILNRKHRSQERLMEIFEERIHPISVYIERLLNYAEIDLCPSNWRRIVLGAIMLASKVWDDQAVWNVDYCQILHDTNVDDMNELERQFLECLEFNINVPSSVYAKYYYDLRTLAIANDLQLPLQPLYKERAKKLEALSRNYEDKMTNISALKKRSHSAEHLNECNRAPVIIP